MKVLLVVQGRQTPEARERRLLAERSGTGPHFSAFEAALNTQSVDLTLLDQAPALRRFAYRWLPPYVALSMEAFCQRQAYDVIVTWSEKVAVVLALMQRFSRRRTPHVALLYWMSKPNIKGLFRLSHPAMTSIVTWSSVQRTFAIEELGIAAERIHLVQHPTDPAFWCPGPELPAALGPADYICSAGAEMRDFPTLIEAMRGLDVPCRIAAREIRVPGRVLAKVLKPKALAGDLPVNIEMRPYAVAELRQLYQGSRFVVIPLLQTDTDNGITVILEAMAAGKAVICTRTRGQVDVIQDGVTGLLVAGGDPEALRAAILRLWQQPAEAARLGRNARAYIEASRHPLERFAADVASAVGKTLVNGQT